MPFTTAWGSSVGYDPNGNITVGPPPSTSGGGFNLDPNMLAQLLGAFGPMLNNAIGGGNGASSAFGQQQQQQQQQTPPDNSLKYILGFGLVAIILVVVAVSKK